MTGIFEGSVSLVTGASSGIGEATAKALAKEGMSVALLARRRDRLEATVAQISAGGGKALAIEGDITDRAAVRGAIDQTVKKFGKLDALINNAGVMLLGAFETSPFQEWERMIALNELGLLYCCEAALPHLVAAAKNGTRQIADIINIGSMAGRRPLRAGATYSMTKFGVTGFSDALRQELARRRVRVSVVEPGLVATELSQHVRPEAFGEMNKYPPMEPIQPQDIAATIAFMLALPARTIMSEIVICNSQMEF